jgi:HrpA-like RNA helicase
MTQVASPIAGFTVERVGITETVENQPTERLVTLGEPTPPPAPEPGAAPAEPETEPSAAPSFDPKLTFGEEYDSVDKVKSVLGDYNKVKERLADYEKRVESNPYIKSRLQWVSEGRDESLHDLVYHSDPEKLSPAQKVALKLQIESGLTPDEAQRHVNYTYKQGEDFDAEDPTVVYAQTQLKIDAKAADTFIQQWRAKASEPLPTFDYARQVETWNPHVDKTVEALNNIDLLDGIKFAADPASLNAVREHLKTVLGTEGVQMDINNPQDMQALQTMAKEHYIAKNFDRILSYYRNEWEKAAIRKDANVPQPAGTQTPPAPGKAGEINWSQFKNQSIF